MKQVAYRPGSGDVIVAEVPEPSLRPGWILVANRYSLLSGGTERSKLELSEKSLLQKARSRPDLVRKTVARARVDGVRSTIAVARDSLDALTPIGYSSAGVVLRVGAGVAGIAPGDLVACGGGGWANHAEVVAVPRNLVATVPANIDLADATYATLGAIAMHGVRRAESSLGERVGVVGLGLVGQLAVRILRAAGCMAIGIDPDAAARDLGKQGGAHVFRPDDATLEEGVLAATVGIGLDAVLVCAATSSTGPVELAARLARRGGRIVVVGDVPVSADRALLYEKELELRLSRSYGPGRYDRDYEERSRDVPAEYVRWTEGRNLESFVELVSTGRIEPGDLTTHRFPVENAQEAYAVLRGDANGKRPFGILLEYREREAITPSQSIRRAPSPGIPRIGLVGAGSFARATILPALKQAGARLEVVTTGGGLSASDVCSRFGFARTAASADEVIADPDVDAVVIATRHASHAALAAAALRAGKAVFVEKPLALDEDELRDVEEALTVGAPLMVGFNRRFAPLVEQLRELLPAATPPVLLARVNAGPLAVDHWLHDPEDGGGRLLGEGCHFVDLLAYLAGAPPISVHAVASPQPDRPLESSDCFVASLRFAAGGVASLVYTGAGDARLPKERIEAFAGGVSAVLDDFRRLETYVGGKRRVTKSAHDKGHSAEIARFVAVVAGQAEAPSSSTYLSSTRATLALAESLRTGVPVDVMP